MSKVHLPPLIIICYLTILVQNVFLLSSCIIDCGLLLWCLCAKNQDQLSWRSLDHSSCHKYAAYLRCLDVNLLLCPCSFPWPHHVCGHYYFGLDDFVHCVHSKDVHYKPANEAWGFKRDLLQSTNINKRFDLVVQVSSEGMHMLECWF